MRCISQGLGRGGEIRTHDHLHPMQVRYQAALRPGNCCGLYQSKVIANVANNLRQYNSRTNVANKLCKRNQARRISSTCWISLRMAMASSLDVGWSALAD